MAGYYTKKKVVRRSGKTPKGLNAAVFKGNKPWYESVL
jgi:hypothetical protein